MALIARHAIPSRPAVTLPHLPRPNLPALASAAAIAFLVLLIDAMLNPRAFFDLSAMRHIQAVTFPGLPELTRGVDVLTGSFGALTAWVVVLVAFAILRWWVPALAAAALPIGGAINFVVGEVLVARTRPHLPELVRQSGNFEERSFPSGHVMGAVMLYGLLIAVAARRVRSAPLRLAIQGFSLMVIAVVGFARVWAGAHWPTDVLGAYALGGLLLAGLVAAYARVDAAVGHLPLVRAAAPPHDERQPHAHALTSLVLFDRATVTKLYAPGLIPTVLYWLAFQARFPYVANQAALRAAIARRNLAGLLTEYWYGANRVARATGIVERRGRAGLVSERIVGAAPTDRAAAKAFLRDLRTRFDEAGLPTWQIDPRQPRAIDNLLETADGSYTVVDLESGLVSPLASLRTWGRALRRGLIPFFDETFHDVTRAYVAREEAAMRAALGDAKYAELLMVLAAGEAEARAWHASEPRLWSRALRTLVSICSVRTWPARTRARLADSRERGLAWIDRAIATWETEARITAAEAATLRAQVEAPTFQAMLPYLGAHIIVSIPLRFPLGSIVRPLMVLGALTVAGWRRLRGRSDREAWRLAWSIHSPLVVALAAVPGAGSFAYLAAKPVRANRLLLRALADVALRKLPWQLYRRSRLSGLVARPAGAAGTDALVTIAPVPTAAPLAPAAWWDEPAAVAASWD